MIKCPLHNNCKIIFDQLESDRVGLSCFICDKGKEDNEFFTYFSRNRELLMWLARNIENNIVIRSVNLDNRKITIARKIKYNTTSSEIIFKKYYSIEEYQKLVNKITNLWVFE